MALNAQVPCSTRVRHGPQIQIKYLESMPFLMRASQSEIKGASGYHSSTKLESRHSFPRLARVVEVVLAGETVAASGMMTGVLFGGKSG